MRVASKIAVVAAAAATALGVGLGPALADPPSGTVPALTSIVGVGSNTTALVMDAMSTGYNATKPADDLWSWDAVNPVTGATGQTIETKGTSKSDTTCDIARPDGSGAGVTALSTTKTDGGQPCINYARSSSPPSATSPAGLVFVGMAKDAVTWVTTTAATGAPKTLDETQLHNIYSANTGKCLTWKDVGGTSTDPIVPGLPQTSSGTRSFFLAAIDVTTPGTCTVNGEINIPSDPNNPVLLEENTGVSGTASGKTCTSADWAACTTGNAYWFANNANALYPYSAADWIAQAAAPAGGGHTTPLFGHGVVTEPGEISGVSPITAGSPDTISTAFTTGTATKVFTRVVYNVVPNVGTTSAPKIAAGAITDIFGPKGYICSSSGTTTLKSYGFLPLGSLCGFLTAG
jgi:ABC-type phosphate transport system substrate-binding protein